MNQNVKLTFTNSALLYDPTKYRRQVDRLIFLTDTRSDIAYSVHTLSQFKQEPRISNWDVVIQILH